MTLLISFLFFCLFSCSVSQAPPSPLQRFDALGPLLGRIDRESATVGRDVNAINLWAKRGSLVHVRGASLQLKVHALGFKRDAGRAGNRIHGLAMEERKGPVSTYLNLAVQVFRRQWYEAAALARLADVVWADPFLRTGPDLSRARRISQDARWFAWRAVLSSRAADWIRRSHRQLFRYPAIKYADS